MPKARAYKPFSHLNCTAAFQAVDTSALENGNQIPGVVVISKGPCRGHFAVREEDGKLRGYDPENPAHKGKPKLQIMVDETMLEQVVQCGNSRPTVKAKMNHSSDVATHFGYYREFYRDGDHVRAELNLFPDLEAAKTVRNIAKHTPTEYGNSIEYTYRYELDPTGKFALARCIKLSSVDIVDDPAATRAMLEEIQTEDPNPSDHMPLTPEEIQQLRAAIKEDTEKTIEGVTTRLTALETKVNEATAKLSAPPTSQAAAPTQEELEKAALSALHKAMPKASLDRLNEIASKKDDKEETFEDKVNAKLSAKPELGYAKAKRIVADEEPALYDAYRKRVG